MRKLTYGFIIATALFAAISVMSYFEIVWVDGPSGYAPVDMERCNYDDDYFNIYENQCEGISIYLFSCLFAILFFAWIIYATVLWGRLKGRRSRF